MIDPVLYRYTVIVLNDGNEYDITNAIQNISWEDLEDELAARMSFTSRNDEACETRVSEIATPGSWVVYMYSYNNGTPVEAISGKIEEWSPFAKNDSEVLRVKAYDILRDMQDSQDVIYSKRGRRTKKIIKKIFKKWKIPLAYYDGPNVKMGKLAYKEKLGSAIIKILDEAKKKGGKDAVLRASMNQVGVAAMCSNATVFHLEEGRHITEINHRITTSGMVTRVKVTGKQKKNGTTPIKATVNGETEYGIRQKLYSRGKDETQKAAKKAAKAILDEDGSPKETISVKCVELPFIRKGDMISVDAETIDSGYYCVMSVSHSVDEMIMTLDLESADGYEIDDGGGKKYKKGTTVTFKGGKYYKSSKKGAKGSKAAAGKAKITKVKSGAAHPYRLSTKNYKKSKVNGWVDSGSFS